MSNYDFTNIGYNNDNYYARDSRVYLIKGSQTAPTSSWSGSLPDGIEEYGENLTIDYFLPFESRNDPVYLSLGGKEAKPVYINGDGVVTTQFPQYSVIRLTYIVNSALNNGNGCWEAVSAILSSDSKVTQIPSTSNSSFEVLFSNSANNAEETATVKKTSTLTYNPSTKALVNEGSINGLDLEAKQTGFTISGGNTSKTLTVDKDFILADACERGVTDNSIPTEVTSTDKNLITGRTLYYAGYTKNEGTVTGTGTNGYITKWDSETGITNGPKLGSDTNTFLRNDGTWQVPGITEIPLATSSEVGGMLTGKGNSGVYRGVELDTNGRAYIVQIWTPNSASDSGYVSAASIDHRVWGREGDNIGWQDPNKLYLIYNGEAGSATGEDADLVNSLATLGWTDCISL